MRRTLSTFVLLAFAASVAAPCAVASMSCGMKMPPVVERCGSCAADGGNAQVLKAAPCCSVRPGEDRGSTPAVLSAAASGSAAPVKVLPATVQASPAACSGVGTPYFQGPPGAAGLPSSQARTTVLRL